MNPFRQIPVPQEIKVLHQVWRTIEGWFDFDSLYTQVIRESAENDILVEVGVFKGKSAIFMADLIKKSGKTLKFFAIDPWIPLSDEKGVPYICTMEDFEHNAEVCEVRDFVTPVKKFSVEASKDFEDQSLKFVFIDGNHSYGFVRNDIQAWLPKIVPGGILAGHDYNRSWPGVKQAVDELLPNREIEGESWIWRIPQ